MKRKFPIILTTAAILLAGCSRDVPDNSNPAFESISSEQTSDSSSEKSPQNNPSKDRDSENSSEQTDNADDWQMEEEYLKIEPDFSDNISTLYGLGVMPGHVLLSTTESEMQSYRTVMDYDIKNKSWQKTGNYNELQTMSRDQLQIGGKNYFAYEDLGGQYCMVCIDIAGQDVSYPNTFEFFPPLAAYEALNQTEFFLYLPDMGSSGERQYHVCLYNTENNNYKEIYTGHYSETSDTGTIIQDISAQDNQLYLCCGIYDGSNGYSYKIIICNPSGEPQHEIILDDLKDRLQQNGEHIESFSVLGDCFFFKTLGSGSRYLYAYEDGGLRLIDLPSDSLSLDDQRGDNLRDREKNPYYYFWDTHTKTLYPFNSQTKTFSSLQLGAAEDENLSIGIWDDADGNLMMSYFKRRQNIPDYYYIPQSTILKYME